MKIFILVMIVMTSKLDQKNVMMKGQKLKLLVVDQSIQFV